MDILYCAHKQKNEDRLYFRWCTAMTDMSFEEYKQKIGWNTVFHERQYRQDNSHEETEEEILSKVADILG